MLQAMGVKERVRVMKAAMRRSANELKARAGDILIGSLAHVANRTAMKRTIWTKVYDRSTMFRVTVAGNAHCYPSRMKNRQGNVRELPLGRWLEEGTDGRETSKGYTRGALPRVGFLSAANEEMEATISRRLEENFIHEMEKIAKNYGCI